MNIILTKINGYWPSIRLAIGSAIVGVGVKQSDHALVLRLSPVAYEITIPHHWTFTSCLLTITSADAALSESDLIGLQGAVLSDVELDSKHLDLLFGSIRVSLRS